MRALRLGGWLAAGVVCLTLCVVAVAKDDDVKQVAVGGDLGEVEHVLRIDSATPGVPVAFEGSVAFRAKEGTFKSLSGTTPFETRLAAPAMGLIVHAADPQAPVSVRVSRLSNGAVYDSGAATGRTIVAVWGTDPAGSFITVWE